jgi:hypothetical protein
MANENFTFEDFVREMVSLRAQESTQTGAAGAPDNARRTLRDDRALVEALAALDTMAPESEQKIASFALESAVRLTGSETGWMGVLSNDGNNLVKHYWSRAVVAGCLIKDSLHSITVRNGGRWNRPIVEKKPVIINDFSAPGPGKKGTPLGHVPLHRFLGVPVLAAGRVRAIVGIGNKRVDYDQNDVRTVKMLFNSAWRIIGQKKTESALHCAHAQFELLFDLLGKGIYSMDLAALAEIEMAANAAGPPDFDNAENRQQLERPLQTLISITGVIDDIKAAYRDRGGLHLFNMDLGQVLASIKEEYTTIPHKHLTINYVPAPGCCIRANGLLRTVFSSLIENAIKGSSPERPLTIDISTMSLEVEGREHYVVVVEVNGTGLCHLQSALCNEGDACTGGLQYALIKTLVGHFSGRMWAEDLERGEPDKGCRTFILLPKA